MGQPYAVRITVMANEDFDPELPTGATIKVTKPSGAEVSWTATIPAQSAQSATAVYALASSGLDLDQPGTWRAYVQWTVAGQTPGPRSEPTSFLVLAADQQG
jgi:hypothetical protein